MHNYTSTGEVKLTNDDKAILASGNTHIDLVFVSYEAKVLPEPNVVSLDYMLVPNLGNRLRSNRGQNHNSKLISYRKQAFMMEKINNNNINITT